MSHYKISFSNVGRDNANFEAKCTELPDEDTLYAMVRNHLLSSDIWFGILKDDAGKPIQHGKVFAGMRAVGEFVIAEMGEMI